MTHRTVVALLMAAAWMLTSCAAGPPAPIPAPIVETIPKPPVSPTPVIWQPGHWDWTGSSYVWIPGQYVEAAGHSGTWMPGFWEKTDSGWAWRPAHWI